MYDFGLVHYWLTAGRVFILMHRNRQARTISAHGLPVLCYSLKLSRQIKHDECWMHCVHKTLVFLLNSCLLQDHHILTRKSLLVLSIYQQQLTQFRQTVRYDRTSHVWRLNRVPFHSFVQSDTACQLFFLSHNRLSNYRISRWRHAVWWGIHFRSIRVKPRWRIFRQHWPCSSGL
jgi:hypothetical protein